MDRRIDAPAAFADYNFFIGNKLRRLRPEPYAMADDTAAALRDRFMKAREATLKRFRRWPLGFGSVRERWLHAHLPGQA